MLFLTSSRIESNQRQKDIVPDRLVTLIGRAIDGPFDLWGKDCNLSRTLDVV